jgi:ABC-type multidrug transport system ATPase subunit
MPPQQKEPRETPTTGAPILNVAGLTKRYDGLVALNNVTFSLQPGAVVALLGPNGAGKTTTFKCILGVTDFEGSIEVAGLSVKRQGKEVRRRIGYLPQTSAFNEGDTCEEVLQFLAELKGADPARVGPLLQRVDLSAQRRTRVAHLSGGMRQRLALAAALLSDPPLLLFDEPTANLDVESRHKLHDAIKALRDEGKTILISTHFVDSLGNISDRVIVLRQGRLEFEGTLADLAGPAQKRRYVVNLNGAAPAKFLKALQDIGIGPDRVEPEATRWEDIVASAGMTEPESDEGGQS